MPIKALEGLNPSQNRLRGQGNSGKPLSGTVLRRLRRKTGDMRLLAGSLAL